MTPYEISGLLSIELAKDTASPPMAVEAAGKGVRGEGSQASVPAVLSKRIGQYRGEALAPLHDLEDSLQCLLDTEDCVTPEQEQAFLEDFSMTMQATVAKRDRVAGFIRHCEAQAEVAADEIRRLQARKRILENAAERVRNYVLWIIEGIGPDDKGKLRKLEGNKFTFSTRKAKPKLEITNEGLIPREYMDVTITLNGPWYIKVWAVLHALGMHVIGQPTWLVNEESVRLALEGAPTECEACGGSGHPLMINRDTEEFAFRECPDCGGSGVVPPSVPGARLITDRNSLVLR
jgi:hypothetical protein